MKSTLKIIFGLFLAYILSGCTTTVTVIEYKVIAVPKTMTLPCADVPPPDYYSFMTLPINVRIDKLSDRSFGQSTVITTCNNKLSAIDKWSDDQVAIYTAKNAQEKGK